MKKIIGTLFLVIFALASCKKEETAATQEHEPTIRFLSPTPSQLLNEDDTLWIRIGITSDDDLHEYLVQVRDITADKIVYTYEGHSHDKSADINVYMMPDVAMDTEMELIVTTLDHNSNKSSKSISFKVINTVKPAKPSITLLSPNAGMYDDGEKLSLKGFVTHTRNLRSVNIQLLQNNIQVFSFRPAINKPDSVGFDTVYTINSPAYSDFELVITAIDVDENSAVKTHLFHVHH
ncbi:MAG: hypothetical protein V4658_05165 [Bacteroidota bacterium]